MRDLNEEKFNAFQKSISDDFLEEAGLASYSDDSSDEKGGIRMTKKKNRKLRIIIPLAACLCLLFSVGYIKVVKPLEYHADVHQAADASKMSLDNLLGEWEYDEYDAYILINEDGTWQTAADDKVYGTKYEYTVMDDCLVLNNEYGGEDSVLYFTEDGRLVDAAGDTLHLNK